LSVFINENLPKLVKDQRQTFDSIIDGVRNNSGKIFYAPGGTEKTFLANLILEKVRQSGKNGLAVASLVIATTLLNDGKTAHSTFKIPLTLSLEQQTVFKYTKQCILNFQ